MVKRLLFLSLFIVVSCVVKATNYYVSTSGNDNNSGTSGSPWRTLAKACSSVPANAGHIINIGSGTFVESNIITVPGGVSIIGAGSANTIIKINHYFYMGNDVNPHTTTYPEHFVIQMNGSNQTVKGFSLDGQSQQCHGGIFARNMTNTLFEDLYIYNFRYCGLWVPEVYSVEIRNCHLKHNSYGSVSNGDSGNLQFHDGDGLSVHDNLIEESGALSTDMGGYGMKAQWLTWGGGGALGSELRNLKIYNNTITVPQTGAWNNGQAPAISIEFLTCDPNQMEIYNNTLNNCISLPGNSSFICGRVHNNNFPLGIGRYAYAVEASKNNLEIDHNYFDGGIYPIACFGDNPANQKVHHNIFINQRGGREVLMYGVSPANYKFYNNTIVDTQGVSGVLMGWASALNLTNPDIRNNIFMSTYGSNRDIFGANVSGGTVSNNCFYNVVPKGSNYITSNPLLTMSGASPAPYFQLQSGSPCINVGAVISGITDGYSGSAPDLGAFEYGVSPWTVGAQSNVAVTGVSVSPASATLTSAGATQQLTATVSPSNATNKTVTWSSSNTGVATVSSGGLVTAVANGTATITVTTQDQGKTATCAVTVNIPPSGNGDGLKGDYYNTVDLTGTVALSRVDATLNFDFGTGSYASGQNTDNFSVRWTGQVLPRYSETYTFETETDDGVRLWVNGTQLINSWVDQAATKRSGTISLTAGQKYDIKMEYYERTGGASARLRWSSASQAYEIIPQSQLFSSGTVLVTGVSVSPTSATLTSAGATQQLTATVSPSNATNKTVTWSSSNTGVATVSSGGLVTAVANGTATITVTTQDQGKTATCAVTVNIPSSGNGDGLKGDYYNTVDLSGTVALSRVDATLDFNFGTGSYASGQNADNFSVRWTGQVLPRYSETYTFETETDDGVRLWVNGTQLINSWVDQAATKRSGTISLTAGQKYDIKMEYYERTGGASARLRWSSASQAYEIIPQSQLFSASSAPADIVIQAESYNSMSGILNKGTVIGNFSNNDWVAYNNVDLKNGYATLSASVACDANNYGHTIECRLGSPTGTLIGTLTIPNTGGWTTFQTISTTLSGGTGINTIYFVGVSNTNDVGDVDWFKFSSPNTLKSGKIATGVALETDNNPDVKIYPNPSSGLLNLELPKESNYVITVYDIHGREILQKKDVHSHDQLDLSANKGLLIIKVNSDKVTAIRQVVIQ